MRLNARVLWLGAVLLSGALSACQGGGADAVNLGRIGSPTVVGSELGWVGSWAAAPYGPYPLGPLTEITPVDPLALSSLSLFQEQQAVDQSFRMIVHPTLGGETLRLRFSNLVGDRPITLTSIKVARRAAGPALVPGTEVPVTFGGQPAVIIAPGAEAISDGASYPLAAGQDLAVSFHLTGESGPMTWHAVSFGLNYVGLPMAGDTTGDPTGLSFAAQPTTGWFFLSGVDVLTRTSPGAVVAIGDSITDGAYETPETNTRWPDFFAQRLQAAGIEMGVLNQGINSNTVTTAREGAAGPGAVLRFERDVLQRSGVRSVVIFEGTNDLTAGVKADAVFAGIRSLIDRARAAGLCVVLGTIMPRDDVIFGWDRATLESERQALNDLIRHATGVAGIADFDAAMGNPLDPTRPNPLYYSPDLLHPTTLGFQVMADAVPLEALVLPPAGTCANR